MEFAPAIAALALIVKIIDFARYARARDVNGIVTQLVTWVAGVVVFLLVAQTAWAREINIADRPMDQLGFWSLAFAGLSIASTASLVKDTLKAVDNTNSAKIPTLVPSAGVHPSAAPHAGDRSG